jgi:hypothetical protein
MKSRTELDRKINYSYYIANTIARVHRVPSESDPNGRIEAIIYLASVQSVYLYKGVEGRERKAGECPTCTRLGDATALTRADREVSCTAEAYKAMLD